MKMLWTIPEIAEEAMERFSITGSDDKTTKKMKKMIITKIERTLEKKCDENGIPYMELKQLRDDNNKDGRKSKFFDETTLSWLFDKALKDYLENKCTDNYKKAEFEKNRTNELKARKRREAYRKYIDNRNYDEEMASMQHPDDSPDYRLIGIQGDEIYRYMIEKLFAKFFGEFDFELYEEDYYTNSFISCDPEETRAEHIDAIERYKDLSNYHSEKNTQVHD